MIEEIGTVLKVDGNYALVATARKSTCGGCAAKNSCGTGVIGKFVGNRYSSIRVLNKVGAHVGEKVILGVPEKILTTVSFRFYIVPLILLLLFSLTGEWIANELSLDSTEPFSILGGLLGLMVGSYWLSRFSKKMGCNGSYQVVILRRDNSVGFVPDVR